VTAKSSRQNEDQICCYRSINSNGLRVLWEVTSACNLECDFCLVEKKHRQLPLETVLQMADELADAGVEKLMISGGEPLVYRGIEKLLQRLIERGVLVKLLTNGTVHNPQVFQLIRESPTVEVSLSLQSVDEEKADRIFRKPGAFRKIVQAIDMLPRERLNVITACGTMNIEDIEQVIDWVADKRIPCISVINVFKDPSSPARFLEDCRIYKLQSDRVAGLFELIGRKREQYRDRLAIRTTQFHGNPGEVCGAGRSVLYLDCTGCLFPCTLTENSRYRATVQAMSITDAIRYYGQTLPPLPSSSCLPLLTKRAPVEQGTGDLSVPGACVLR
jgi:MoaA/NifB/PqqE/SkfB family radical SAM enzyme